MHHISKEKRNLLLSMLNSDKAILSNLQSNISAVKQEKLPMLLTKINNQKNRIKREKELLITKSIRR